ncbi:hypothetical protein LUZ60_013615 [Juncus effusus]|nr:hypothetical protein LUZ60_013615 [Juncus effusus]
MENFEIGENQNQTCLLSELSLIRQFVVQLQTQFNNPSNSTIDFSKCIVSQLLSKTEHSISLAKSCGFGSNHIEPVSPPRSASGSPRSDMSDLAFKNQDNRVCKKRKTQTKWKNQVRVGSMGGGGEGQLDDGFSWRKYGQKDILGAKHPRGYYRCTHRNSQSCLATKQVQRTDDDPTVFDVIYQGTHTCVNKSRNGSNTNNNNNCKQKNQLKYDQDYLNSLKATLTVKTEGSGSLGLAQEEAQDCNSISFSFPSTTIGASHMSSVDNCFNISNSFLPSFANSPATSESNYFSIPPCTISGYGTGVGSGLGFHKVNSDLTEIVSGLSAATSTTNSPMGDVDHLVFDGLDFDQNFQVDPSNFFA